MMFKRKLFVLGVFALAVVTIVGSGFSAWTFTTESREDLSTGVAITESYAFGAIKHELNAWRIVLDQGNVGLTDGIRLEKGVTGGNAPNINSNDLTHDDKFVKVSNGTTQIKATWYISIEQFNNLYNTEEIVVITTAKDDSVSDANAIKVTSVNATELAKKLDFNLNLYISPSLSSYIKPSADSNFKEDNNNSVPATGGAHTHDNYKAYQVDFTYFDGTGTVPSAYYTVKVGTDSVEVKTASQASVNLPAYTYFEIEMVYSVNPNNLFVYNTSTDNKSMKPATFAEYRTMIKSISAYPSTVNSPVTTSGETTTVDTSTAIQEENAVMAGLQYYIPNAANPVVFEFQVKNIQTKNS